MTTRRALYWLLGVLLVIAATLFAIYQPAIPYVATTGRRRNALAGILPRVRPAPVLQRIRDNYASGVFVPTDRTVTIEISEYAGYAGLIVANGGLEPSETSTFFRDHNFRVKLSIREKESFEDLNAGRLGATVTTADVVAIYGKNLNGLVPVLIGFSRGADGLVTRRDITSLGGLKGKVLATAQFSEAEFLVRYLATRIDVGVNLLPNIDAMPDPSSINLVFAENAFDACDMLLTELILNRSRLSACAAWEPRTSSVVQRSGGAAHFLTTNRNLLVIADVLVVNRGLAEQHPEMVAGLVDGLLAGNEQVRDSPETTLSDISKAFSWTRDKARSELAKVHLASMPDNLEFFSGAPNEIGSFAHIHQSALEAYKDLTATPRPAADALDMQHLRALQESGKYAERPTPVGRLRPLVAEAEPVESLPSIEVLPDAPVLPPDHRVASPEPARSDSKTSKPGAGEN